MKSWLLICLLMLPAEAQPLPTLPRWPPAPLRNQTEAQAPTPGTLVQKWTLQPGWNAVSFPFAVVQGCSGFEHGLVDYSGVYLDPYGSGAEIRPGKAYWAYADRQQEASAWGEALTRTTNLELQPGWNFVGCPLAVAIDFSQLTFGDGQQVNRLLEEAALATPAWLDSRLFAVHHDRFEALDLLTARSQMLPGRAYWLYAQRPLTMRVNLPAEVPAISAVQHKDNFEMQLEGQNFGAAEVGRLVINRTEVSPLDVLEWTPTRIRLRVPPGLRSQRVAVVAGGAASPRVLEDTAPSAEGSVAPNTELSLTILSEENLPVAGARVELTGHAPVTTGRDGLARFAAVASGPLSLKVTAPNYLPRSTRVTVPAATPNYRGAVTLYSPRSSMYVRATPCTGGWRPARIEIYQKRNWRFRAWKTFPTDQRLQYAELFWGQCPTNVVYCIEIYWRNRDGLEKRLLVERKLGYYGLQETFYNFWGYY